MTELSYSKNYETLIALVTYLAVNKWPSRQPIGIANDLSLDVSDVRHVLSSFKSLFRQSAGKTKDHGEPLYSLHLRYSRKPGDDGEERPPLESEYLIPFLELISKRAEEESKKSSAMSVALLTGSISLVVSGISLFVALHK